MQLNHSEATIERLTLWQRCEHALMGLSVVLLILSGMALTYHQQAWAHALIQMMGGLQGRYFVHRTAAIGLLIAGILHLSGLLVSKRHQHEFREVLPRLSDFKDAWDGLIRALTGKGERPRYGWFTPMQKLQYWGVLLGCLIMGLSGALLWSPTFTLGLFPKWLLDLTLLIHAKEAQFIFIFFIVWHLYDVHVAGGNFPMNPAWITGNISKEIFARQHAAVGDVMPERERL